MNIPKKVYDLQSKIRQAAVITEQDLQDAAGVAKATGNLEHRVLYVYLKAAIAAQENGGAE